MYCLQGAWVRRGDPYSASRGRTLECVRDRSAIRPHHRDAGQFGVMNKHRKPKISLGEHLGNMVQMTSYLIKSSRVCLVIRRHFDDAAIRE
jgi:hypothetical protein